MATTRTRKRRPGRPADSAADLRGQLLDHAARLIARRGYAAMTLRELATAARVTPALVHYYFGGKARLLDALVEERIAPVFRGIAEPLMAAQSRGGVDLGEMVRVYTQTMLEHPWLPPILAREVVCEGGVLRDRFVRGFAGPMAGALPALFQREQRQARLRDDLDPRLMALSMISLLVFPIVAMPVWRQALAMPVEPTFADTLTRHTTAVLMRGLEAPHA